MRKVLIVTTVAAVFAFTFLLYTFHNTYSRIRILSENYAVNSFAIDEHMKWYYRDNLSFPNSRKEMNESLARYENDYLLNHLSKIDYRFIIEENQITIYDLGFNNIDDSLKNFCNSNRTGFIAAMFEDGDFVIYKKKFEDPEKLLAKNYFIYDSNQKIIDNQVIYEEKINATRRKFLNNHYMEKFGLEVKDFRLHPGEELDTILVHGIYDFDMKEWQVSTKKHEFDLDVFDSLFTEIRNEDKEVAEFYITIKMVFDKTKIYVMVP